MIILTESSCTGKLNKLNRVCCKVSSFGNWFILALSLLIFVFLALQSLLNTTIMYNAPEDPSTVIFTHDNFYINLLCIAVVFICGLLFLRKLMEKINPKIFGASLLVYTFVLGLIWNLLTKNTPAHDSWFITAAAESFAVNDYTPLILSENDYFYNYPFQLGYAFLCEIAVRIFGDNTYFVLQIINILSSVAIAAALIVIAKLAFDSRKVTNFTIFFLFGCIQPVLFTTFHYGNLSGFAFSMWAVVFACLLIKKRKWYYIPLSAVCIGIGSILKTNSLIVLIAVCVILFLDFLKKFSVKNIIAIALSLVMGIGLNPLIIYQYEQRADVSLGDGVPMVLWLDMGLQETGNANRPGWYNPEYTVLRYAYSEYDGEKAAESGWADIRERTGELAGSASERARFFTAKTLSQWNDPLYMSIWVSETRPSRIERGEFVQSMYTGNAGAAVRNFANFYQSLIFVFAAAGVLIILMKKKMRQNIFCAVLPLVFLGGFFYHLLFEAMPQYNVTYFTLFIPLAAYGFSELCDRCHDGFRAYLKTLFKKKKNIESTEQVSAPEN